LAKLLFDKGYRIVLVAHSKEKLEVLARSFASSADALPISVDIGDAQAVKKAVEEVYTKWGRIDVLVNNVDLALGSPKQFHEQTINDLVSALPSSQETTR
jgi:NADP-dependent 3-hydroxy acid dehydrogenase YdfG